MPLGSKPRFLSRRLSNLDNSQYEKISTKLDKIINLLALNAVKGLEPEDQIGRLSDMKFQPMEIAPIVGKTPNAVRIVLFRIRKERAKGEQKDAVGEGVVAPEGQVRD